MSAPIVPGSYEIEAPEPLIVPGGLTSLVPVVTPDEPYWFAGYYYRTAEYAQHVRNWDTERTEHGEDLGSDDDPEMVQVVPFMMEVEGSFSAMHGDRNRLNARVERELDRHTSQLLERELWHGEIAQAKDLPNKYLTKPGYEDLGHYTDAMRGISALVGEGAQMVHVPRQVALSLPQDMKNTDWLDYYGFVIVAGEGYPIERIAQDSTARIYGTKLVNIKASQVFNESSDFDRGTNTFTYRAQRYGAVDFAGPVLSATVDF